MSVAEALLGRLRTGDARARRDISDLGEDATADKDTIDELLDGLALMARTDSPVEVTDLVIGILCSQPFLRAEVYRIVLRDVEAEEVLQDALLSIAQALPTFRGESKFRTWARRIAHNAAVGQLRRRRESTGRIEDVAEAPGEVERFTSVLATRSDVHAALDAIPPDFAEVVRMRDLEHLTYEQIADQLGIKLNTVRSRLARGRARLAALLEPR